MKNKKYLFSILIFLSCIFTIILGTSYLHNHNFKNVYAEENLVQWEPKGRGTKYDPYLIDGERDYHEYVKLANDSTSNGYVGGHYRITRDLNFRNNYFISFINFYGALDGRFHKITGMNDMLVYNNSGTIKNLEIIKPEITKNNITDDVKYHDSHINFYGVGTVAGVNTGTIEYVGIKSQTSAGKIKFDISGEGDNYIICAGGIAGINATSNGRIQDCYVYNTDITAIGKKGFNHAFAGGICGYLTVGEMSRCISTATASTTNGGATYAGYFDGSVELLDDGSGSLFGQMLPLNYLLSPFGGFNRGFGYVENCYGQGKIGSYMDAISIAGLFLSDVADIYIKYVYTDDLSYYEENKYNIRNRMIIATEYSIPDGIQFGGNDNIYRTYWTQMLGQARWYDESAAPPFWKFVVGEWPQFSFTKHILNIHYYESDEATSYSEVPIEFISGDAAPALATIADGKLFNSLYRINNDVYSSLVGYQIIKDGNATTIIVYDDNQAEGSKWRWMYVENNYFKFQNLANYATSTQDAHTYNIYPIYEEDDLDLKVNVNNNDYMKSLPANLYLTLKFYAYCEEMVELKCFTGNIVDLSATNNKYIKDSNRMITLSLPKKIKIGNVYKNITDSDLYTPMFGIKMEIENDDNDDLNENKKCYLYYDVMPTSPHGSINIQYKSQPTDDSTESYEYSETKENLNILPSEKNDSNNTYIHLSDLNYHLNGVKNPDNDQLQENYFAMTDSGNVLPLTINILAYKPHTITCNSAPGETDKKSVELNVLEGTDIVYKQYEFPDTVTRYYKFDKQYPDWLSSIILEYNSTDYWYNHIAAFYQSISSILQTSFPVISSNFCLITNQDIKSVKDNKDYIVKNGKWVYTEDLELYGDYEKNTRSFRFEFAEDISNLGYIDNDTDTLKEINDITIRVEMYFTDIDGGKNLFFDSASSNSFNLQNLVKGSSQIFKVNKSGNEVTYSFNGPITQKINDTSVDIDGVEVVFSCAGFGAHENDYYGLLIYEDGIKWENKSVRGNDGKMSLPSLSKTYTFSNENDWEEVKLGVSTFDRIYFLEERNGTRDYNKYLDVIEGTDIKNVEDITIVEKEGYVFTGYYSINPIDPSKDPQVIDSNKSFTSEAINEYLKYRLKGLSYGNISVYPNYIEENTFKKTFIIKVNKKYYNFERTLVPIKDNSGRDVYNEYYITVARGSEDANWEIVGSVKCNTEQSGYTYQTLDSSGISQYFSLNGKNEFEINQSGNAQTNISNFENSTQEELSFDLIFERNIQVNVNIIKLGEFNTRPFFDGNEEGYDETKSVVYTFKSYDNDQITYIRNQDCQFDPVGNEVETDGRIYKLAYYSVAKTNYANTYIKNVDTPTGLNSEIKVNIGEFLAKAVENANNYTTNLDVTAYYYIKGTKKNITVNFMAKSNGESVKELGSETIEYTQDGTQLKTNHTLKTSYYNSFVEGNYKYEYLNNIESYNENLFEIVNDKLVLKQTIDNQDYEPQTVWLNFNRKEIRNLNITIVSVLKLKESGTEVSRETEIEWNCQFINNSGTWTTTSSNSYTAKAIDNAQFKNYNHNYTNLFNINNSTISLKASINEMPTVSNIEVEAIYEFEDTIETKTITVTISYKEGGNEIASANTKSLTYKKVNDEPWKPVISNLNINTNSIKQDNISYIFVVFALGDNAGNFVEILNYGKSYALIEEVDPTPIDFEIVLNYEKSSAEISLIYNLKDTIGQDIGSVQQKLLYQVNGSGWIILNKNSLIQPETNYVNGSNSYELDSIELESPAEDYLILNNNVLTAEDSVDTLIASIEVDVFYSELTNNKVINIKYFRTYYDINGETVYEPLNGGENNFIQSVIYNPSETNSGYYSLLGEPETINPIIYTPNIPNYSLTYSGVDTNVTVLFIINNNQIEFFQGDISEQDLPDKNECTVLYMYKPCDLTIELSYINSITNKPIATDISLEKTVLLFGNQTFEIKDKIGESYEYVGVDFVENGALMTLKGKFIGVNNNNLTESAIAKVVLKYRMIEEYVCDITINALSLKNNDNLGSKTIKLYYREATHRGKDTNGNDCYGYNDEFENLVIKDATFSNWQIKTTNFFKTTAETLSFIRNNTADGQQEETINAYYLKYEDEIDVEEKEVTEEELQDVYYKLMINNSNFISINNYNLLTGKTSTTSTVIGTIKYENGYTRTATYNVRIYKKVNQITGQIQTVTEKSLKEGTMNATYSFTNARINGSISLSSLNQTYGQNYYPNAFEFKGVWSFELPNISGDTINSISINGHNQHSTETNARPVFMVWDPIEYTISYKATGYSHSETYTFSYTDGTKMINEVIEMDNNLRDFLKATFGMGDDDCYFLIDKIYYPEDKYQTDCKAYDENKRIYQELDRYTKLFEGSYGNIDVIANESSTAEYDLRLKIDTNIYGEHFTKDGEFYNYNNKIQYSTELNFANMLSDGYSLENPLSSEDGKRFLAGWKFNESNITNEDKQLILKKYTSLDCALVRIYSDMAYYGNQGNGVSDYLAYFSFNAENITHIYKSLANSENVITLYPVWIDYTEINIYPYQHNDKLDLTSYGKLYDNTLNIADNKVTFSYGYGLNNPTLTLTYDYLTSLTNSTNVNGYVIGRNEYTLIGYVIKNITADATTYYSSKEYQTNGVWATNQFEEFWDLTYQGTISRLNINEILDNLFLEGNVGRVEIYPVWDKLNTIPVKVTSFNKNGKNINSDNRVEKTLEVPYNKLYNILWNTEINGLYENFSLKYLEDGKGYLEATSTTSADTLTNLIDYDYTMIEKDLSESGLERKTLQFSLEFNSYYTGDVFINPLYYRVSLTGVESPLVLSTTELVNYPNIIDYSSMENVGVFTPYTNYGRVCAKTYPASNYCVDRVVLASEMLNNHIFYWGSNANAKNIFICFQEEQENINSAYFVDFTGSKGETTDFYIYDFKVISIGDKNTYEGKVYDYASRSVKGEGEYKYIEGYPDLTFTSDWTYSETAKTLNGHDYASSMCVVLHEKKFKLELGLFLGSSTLSSNGYFTVEVKTGDNETYYALIYDSEGYGLYTYTKQQFESKNGKFFGENGLSTLEGITKEINKSYIYFYPNSVVTINTLDQSKDHDRDSHIGYRLAKYSVRNPNSGTASEFEVETATTFSYIGVDYLTFEGYKSTINMFAEDAISGETIGELMDDEDVVSFAVIFELINYNLAVSVGSDEGILDVQKNNIIVATGINQQFNIDEISLNNSLSINYKPSLGYEIDNWKYETNKNATHTFAGVIDNIYYLNFEINTDFLKNYVYKNDTTYSSNKDQYIGEVSPNTKLIEFRVKVDIVDRNSKETMESYCIDDDHTILNIETIRLNDTYTIALQLSENAEKGYKFYNINYVDYAITNLILTSKDKSETYIDMTYDFPIDDYNSASFTLDNEKLSKLVTYIENYAVEEVYREILFTIEVGKIVEIYADEDENLADSEDGILLKRTLVVRDNIIAQGDPSEQLKRTENYVQYCYEGQLVSIGIGNETNSIYVQAMLTFNDDNINTISVTNDSSENRTANYTVNIDTKVHVKFMIVSTNIKFRYLYKGTEYKQEAFEDITNIAGDNILVNPAILTITDPLGNPVTSPYYGYTMHIEFDYDNFNSNLKNIEYVLVINGEKQEKDGDEYLHLIVSDLNIILEIYEIEQNITVYTSRNGVGDIKGLARSNPSEYKTLECAPTQFELISGDDLDIYHNLDNGYTIDRVTKNGEEISIEYLGVETSGNLNGYKKYNLISNFNEEETAIYVIYLKTKEVEIDFKYVCYGEETTEAGAGYTAINVEDENLTTFTLDDRVRITTLNEEQAQMPGYRFVGYTIGNHYDATHNYIDGDKRETQFRLLNYLEFTEIIDEDKLKLTIYVNFIKQYFIKVEPQINVSQSDIAVKDLKTVKNIIEITNGSTKTSDYIDAVNTGYETHEINIKVKDSQHYYFDLYINGELFVYESQSDVKITKSSSDKTIQLSYKFRIDKDYYFEIKYYSNAYYTNINQYVIEKGIDLNNYSQGSLLAQETTINVLDSSYDSGISIKDDNIKVEFTVIQGEKDTYKSKIRMLVSLQTQELVDFGRSLIYDVEKTLINGQIITGNSYSNGEYNYVQYEFEVTQEMTIDIYYKAYYIVELVG